MKIQYNIFLFLFLCFSEFSSAQVLCIYCYEQNTPISTGINNLLLNGGFENNTCAISDYFCPNSTNYSCDITNWTCTGGGSYTYASTYDFNFSVIPEGAQALYFGNGICNPCSQTVNDTSCINNISCVAAGIPDGFPINDTTYGGTVGVSLEQTVNGLIPGNTYVLEFWAGGEQGPSYEPGLFAIDIGFGDTLLRDRATPPITGVGTRYIIEFNATSTSHTIKFTNWGHITQYHTELVLDDVRLYTLAELSATVPHCNTYINEVIHLHSEINVFPNPITNTLTTTINNNGTSEIIIKDIASGIILQQEFIKSISLNTEHLARGMYLYEVRNKDGSCKKGKVVKY